MNIDHDRLKRYEDAPLPTRPPMRPMAPPPPPAPPVAEPLPPIPPPASPSPPKPAASTNLTINIAMPKLKRPSLPVWPWKKIAVYAAVIVGLIITSAFVHAVVSFALTKHRQDAAKQRIDMIDQRSSPSFTPLAPANKPSVAKTAAYDPKRDSYSYNDTIKGLQVIVSQQPLPAGATTDTVAKIAKSINATTPIVASKGTAYLASNAGGAQTVVMGSGSLLVFVQSAFTLSVTDWQSYLDTLQS